MTERPDEGSLARFRRELRDWLDAHLRHEVVEAGRGGFDEADNFEVLREWNRQLYEGRWAAVSWPARYGGRDAGIDEQLAYLEEMSRAEAPGPVNVIGVSNIAPAIMAIGTDAQRERFLEPMLRGDEIWSQGMSEPDAGSDLASLRTRADLDGDQFVVNGQKTWNSLGSRGRLVPALRPHQHRGPQAQGDQLPAGRHGHPGHRGPPVAHDGRRAHLLGAVLRQCGRPGLGVAGRARRGLAGGHDHPQLRAGRGGPPPPGPERPLAGLLEEARGCDALGDPVVRDRLAALYSRIACMRWTTTRELEAIGRGAAPSPVMGSGAKLLWAAAEREMAELALAILGPAALCGRWATNLASAPQASIAGGTSEINRTIVAEHGLGLPRDATAR